MEALRQSVFEVIVGKTHKEFKAIWFDFVVSGLIVLNVVAMALESFAEIRNQFSEELFIFEAISVVFFTAEYLLRIWTADLFYDMEDKWRARWKFMKSPLGIIDVLAVLPFWLPMLLTVDMRMMRLFRLIRLLRLLKLQRHSRSLSLLFTVFRNVRTELMMTSYITIILILVMSMFMYHFEHPAQPEKIGDFRDAVWCSFTTLTTIGYGDVYPVTRAGKLVSGLLAILGIGLVAMPTGIISSAAIEVINKRKGRKKHCPHCGEPIS